MLIVVRYIQKGREVISPDLEMSSVRITECQVFIGEALRRGEAFLILGGNVITKPRGVKPMIQVDAWNESTPKPKT